MENHDTLFSLSFFLSLAVAGNWILIALLPNENHVITEIDTYLYLSISIYFAGPKTIKTERSEQL